MENRDEFRKNRNEMNYASKFRDESRDAPKVVRAGTPQNRPVQNPASYGMGTSAPFSPAPYNASQNDVYALRAELMNRESNSQMLFLQSEVARLREEINRQNQKNELRDELARLKEEFKKNVDKPAPSAPAPSVTAAEKKNDGENAERELSELLAELKRTTEETYRADLDENFSAPRASENLSDRAGEQNVSTARAESPISDRSESVLEPSDANVSEILEKLEAMKADISERFRAESENTANEILEKLSGMPAAGSDSIIDTNSIMQSTLLDEIMYLKKVLEEDSVTKNDLSASADRVLEQFQKFFESVESRSRESAEERNQYLTTQFSLLFEMLAYNFETNSALIGESKEAIENKIKTLTEGLGRNSSAAADLVIKLTQIISILGVELEQGKDVITSVREQLDERFGQTESVIRREIEILNQKLAAERDFEEAQDGVDLLCAIGVDKLVELVGEERAQKVLALKARKDEIRERPDVVALAYYIKDKALLLGDYQTLVADVSALKSIAAAGLAAPESAELTESILELPLDKFVDLEKLATFTVDSGEMSRGSRRILDRLEGLEGELKNLEANHETLFENISSSIREISAAVEDGAKAEDLERISERMERTIPEQLERMSERVDRSIPEQLAALGARIEQGIKDNFLDKNETKVRLENLSFELSKLTEFSEISSILYDFKREVEDAIEGNMHELGAEVTGRVGDLSKRISTSLENNDVAIEVAKLAQNVAISPNFDQTIVLDEIGKLKREIAELREAMSVKPVLNGGMDLNYSDDAAYSEDDK